jgi:hypothetical protein
MHYPTQSKKATLFDAVNSVQASGLLDMGRNYNMFTVQIVFTGVITSSTVLFQGSLDGVNWEDLGSSTSTTNDMFHVVNKPIRLVRANLTVLTGTTPTITVMFVTNEEPPS